MDTVQRVCGLTRDDLMGVIDALDASGYDSRLLTKMRAIIDQMDRDEYEAKQRCMNDSI